MTFLERIHQNEESFTKTDFKIAQHISREPQIIEEFAISRVAEVIGTSTAAIIRFCQKLGYSGYSEFRFDLIRATHAPAAEKGTSLMEDYLTAYEAGIRELARIPEERILELLDLIDQADFINCLGARNSSLPAMKFYYDFTALGKKVLPLTGALSPWVNHAATPKDLIIVLSVRKLGCNLVLITCSDKPRIAKYATHILRLPTVHTAGGTPVEPQSMMLMLVNILVAYEKQKL